MNNEAHDLANIAIVNARVACALIRMEGMKAENAIRAHRGESMAYDDAAFESIINEEGVHWNAVHERLYQS